MLRTTLKCKYELLITYIVERWSASNKKSQAGTDVMQNKTIQSQD